MDREEVEYFHPDLFWIKVVLTILHYIYIYIYIYICIYIYILIYICMHKQNIRPE